MASIMGYFYKWQKLEDFTIELRCIQCNILTPDNWLFETDKPHEWVCGDCAGVKDLLVRVK